MRFSDRGGAQPCGQFLTSRIRTWLVFAVAVPLATIGVRILRKTLEARSGQTPLVTALTKIENLGQRHRRSVKNPDRPA